MPRFPFTDMAIPSALSSDVERVVIAPKISDVDAGTPGHLR